MIANSKPDSEVLVHEWTWKSDAMRVMAVAVCELALRRALLAQGASDAEFSALDLPDHGAERHGGSGIAGSVFRVLVDAGIIAPVGVFLGGSFLQRRVRNANGNPIGVWRLADAARARTLVERCGGVIPEPEQMEMRL